MATASARADLAINMWLSSWLFAGGLWIRYPFAQYLDRAVSSQKAQAYKVKSIRPCRRSMHAATKPHKDTPILDSRAA